MVDGSVFRALVLPAQGSSVIDWMKQYSFDFHIAHYDLL